MKRLKVSSRELEEAVEAQQSAYDEETKPLSNEERIVKFDHFYDAVVEVLKKHGSFSDGGLEKADFSSSRYVDPSSVICIVSKNTISEELLGALASELKKLPGVHGVIFDGGEPTAVFSDGRVLVAASPSR